MKTNRKHILMLLICSSPYQPFVAFGENNSAMQKEVADTLTLPTQDMAPEMTWEHFLDLAGIITENDDNADTELEERLYELHSNPLDINNFRAEDLSVLPFLSQEQIEEIVGYAARDGRMESLGELMFLRTLSKQDREMLRLFVEVRPRGTNPFSDRTLWDMVKHGKNEVAWRTDIPLYKREGYKSHKQEEGEDKTTTSDGYRGDNLYHAFRYSFSSGKHLSAGLSMEKDAGERGVDYLSGYVMARDWGILKSFVAGNYRASFGKGLAVNTSVRFGKKSMLTSMDRMDGGFAGHSSVSEYGYFTGCAATARVQDWELSAFVSRKDEDANADTDHSRAKSIVTSGLHRTTLESGKRNILKVTNLGGNLRWGNDWLQVSATAIWTRLGMPLDNEWYNNSSTYYKAYQAHGQNFFVGSVAYAVRYKSFTFSGEAAFSDNEGQHGVASLNSLRWRVDGLNTLMLSGRYYDHKFVSFNGKAFGEQPAPQNEQAIFLSWKSRSVQNMVIEAYVDAMYFPYRRSNARDGSKAFEGFVQSTLSPNDRWSLTCKYGIHSKERDTYLTRNDRREFLLRYYTRQTAKAKFQYQLSPTLSIQSAVSGVTTYWKEDGSHYGLSVSSHLAWRKKSARIIGGLTWFNTDGSEARVNDYESTLLYSFGHTSYLYKGLRATLFGHLPLANETLFLSAKLGMTYYFNRNTIGSGRDAILSNHREDLQVQLRWKF